MENIQKFLLELGKGFACIGRQVHLKIGDDNIYLDPLFYNLLLRCYVVIELKAHKFESGDGAQLGMYMPVLYSAWRNKISSKETCNAPSSVSQMNCKNWLWVPVFEAVYPL